LFRLSLAVINLACPTPLVSCDFRTIPWA